MSATSSLSNISSHYYIGVVAALCRVFQLMNQDQRTHFEVDGMPMERVANDFNAHNFSLVMRRNGKNVDSQWILIDRDQDTDYEKEICGVS